MNDFVSKCKITRNEELGRYLLAAKDLKAGETVLQEDPLLLIPTLGERRCANCWKLATEFCRNCQIFSLCENCETHKASGCEFFVRATERNKNFNIAILQKRHEHVLGLLQLLLLRENAETRPKYEALLQCEAHLAARRQTPLWQEMHEKAIAPIVESGVLTLIGNERGELETYADGDAEWLQRLLGIIDVNSFEIRAPDKATLRGLYLHALLMSHSCVANTLVAVDDEFKMKMYTNRDVACGEILHNCYANALLGTAERREMLQLGKYFHCKCERCEDPTELGSHLSSLICQPCAAKLKQQSQPQQQPSGDEGYIVFKIDGRKWQCLKCSHQVPTDTVNSILERAREEAYHAHGDLRRMEMLLAKLGQILHRNHYIALDLKQNIAAILRAILMRPQGQPGERVYQRKVQLCQDILNALHSIQPGISRLRAIALYELCNTQAELSRLRYAEKQFNADELKQLLQQSEDMLREAVRMLLYEPVNSPEGRAAKDMLRELKQMQQDIEKLNEHP